MINISMVLITCAEDDLSRLLSIPAQYIIIPAWINHHSPQVMGRTGMSWRKYKTNII